MIKASELRISNWVQYTDKAYSGYHKIIDGADIDEISDSQSFEPIPLTPEILEKAGFARRWEGSWQKNSVEIEQSEEQKILGGFILLNGEERSHWPNVYFHLHQLQNLYSALTGAELEINLDK
jgi:hypothetical protein